MIVGGQVGQIVERTAREGNQYFKVGYQYNKTL